MKTEDIIDSKIGSRQVTAMYFGGVLRWPTSGALTYVITGAQLHFSRGSALDAGEVGSNYSGNYAWVTGTVVPYRGDEPQTPLTNVMLVPTVTNTTDFVVRDTYYIYGHNLGTTATYAAKETSVDVTYKTSADFRVGSTVTQTRNIETVTTGTPRIVPTATEEYTDIVPNSYWVTLTITDYLHRYTYDHPCPAYGGSTTIECAGGHTTALYSRTFWEEITPYIHSFSSGSQYTIEEITDEGYYPPVEVTGHRTEVNDDLSNNISLTFSDGGNWATYDYANDLLTIDNAGLTRYNNPRSVTVVVTNGTASDSVTAYQQYNVPEATEYLLAIAIDVQGNIPGEGGLFLADYESNIITTYTSGAETDPAPVNASVTATSNVTLDLVTPVVSGSGTLSFSVSENDSTTLWRDVRITLTSGGNTAYDEVSQEPSQVIVTPKARIWPDLDANNQPRLNFAMTQGSFPAGSVVLSGVQYWAVLENTGDGQPHAVPVGDITITYDGQKVVLTSVPMYAPGTSGEHWFDATSVSRIGKSNITFTHTNFDIMEL